MIAYCYFQPCYGFEPHEEMQIWDWVRLSWEKQGWTIYLLNPEHAIYHPMFLRMLDAVCQRPTVCSWPYTLSCHLRWLALANEMSKHREPSVFLDYDTYNMSLTPAEAQRLYWQSTVMHPGTNPSTVYVKSCEDAEKIVDMLLKGSQHDLEWNKPHLNDNVIFKNHWFGGLDDEICNCYSELRGRERLIHFANRVIPKGTKRVDLIRRWMVENPQFSVS